MCSAAVGEGRLLPEIRKNIKRRLKWDRLRDIQEACIDPILDGRNVLVSSRTSGGKTEAVFFPVLTKLSESKKSGLQVIYICPVKALINNLYERLSMYAAWTGVRVSMWHGDRPAQSKKNIKASAPEILLTTPESLGVMLITKDIENRSFFGNVQFVVMDEVHLVCGQDRGWQLLYTLERIGRYTPYSIQRIGVSATVGNPSKVLEWLGIASNRQSIVVSDMGSGAQTSAEREITVDWVGSIANVVDFIRQYRTDEKRLVFCDSRNGVEEIGSGLSKAGVDVHISHSSLGLEQKTEAEAAFVNSRSGVIVATSTLEVGMDVGDVGVVIQVNSPSSVASLIQRMGRSGRRKGAIQRLCCLCSRENDLTMTAGMVSLLDEGYVEPICPPPLPLNVLAQQVICLCLERGGRCIEDELVDQLCHVSGKAGVDREKVDGVVCAMVERGYMMRDGNSLYVGHEAERSYGYRHWSEVHSVFSVGQTYTVLHERSPIGEISSQLVYGDSASETLTLGGKAWKIIEVRARAGEVRVVRAESASTASWIGAGREITFAHAQSVKRILRGGRPNIHLTNRSLIKLSEISEEFDFLDDEVTIRIGKSGAIDIWTFAGDRYNEALSDAMASMNDGFDSKSSGYGMKVMSMGAGDIRSMVEAGVESRELRSYAPDTDEYVESTKFLKCLSSVLAGDFVQARYGLSEVESSLIRSDGISVVSTS